MYTWADKSTKHQHVRLSSVSTCATSDGDDDAEALTSARRIHKWADLTELEFGSSDKSSSDHDGDRVDTTRSKNEVDVPDSVRHAVAEMQHKSSSRSIFLASVRAAASSLRLCTRKMLVAVRLRQGFDLAASGACALTFCFISRTGACGVASARRASGFLLAMSRQSWVCCDRSTCVRQATWLCMCAL